MLAREVQQRSACDEDLEVSRRCQQFGEGGSRRCDMLEVVEHEQQALVAK